MPQSRHSSIHVLVLAGGKGTRSLNPQVPKLLQKISFDETLLNFHLRNISSAGFSKVTFLVAYKSIEIIQAIQEVRNNWPNLKLDWIEDVGDHGTTKAVLDAVEATPNSDNFLLLLGDTAIHAPLEVSAHSWLDSQAQVGIFCHPNLHTHDSDCVVIDHHRNVTAFFPKGSPLDPTEFSLAVTGAIFFGRTAALELESKSSDITKAIVESAVSRASCQAIVTSHYMRDSGTPTRLDKIRVDVAHGVFERRGRRNRAAIFLDRDGTLFRDTGTARSNVHEADLSDSLVNSIKLANSSGVPIFLVTNQPGIAKGQIDHSTVAQVHARIQQILEQRQAFLDDFAYCPHHPEAGYAGEIVEYKIRCECRKPRAGMLRRLADDHSLSLSSSILIGDSANDEGAALEANCHFLQATFDGEVGLATANAIRIAVKEILNADY